MGHKLYQLPFNSLPSFTAMLLKRGERCFFPSWRLLLALFFDRSEGNLMPSDRAAAQSLPSFTAMHSGRGEGCFLRAGGTFLNLLADLNLVL